MENHHTVMITSRTSAQATHQRWTAASLPVHGFEIFSHLSAGKRKLQRELILQRGVGATIRPFAGRNSVKKLARNGEARKSRVQELNKRSSSDEYDGLADKSSSGDGSDKVLSRSSIGNNIHMAEKSISISRTHSRKAVLKACTITSGLIFAFGLAIREVSHVAFVNGWPVLDCSEVSFDVETWHLELIAGLVVLISSCRFLLLKTWPDFAESSEAANRQVLSSLQPLDYVPVAFFSGISEEVLFRGALLPLLGLNWISALVVSALFGVLHLGSGRRYSFAVWATFVGFAYSYATIASGSIIVPAASHALNNLVGGILWRYNTTCTTSEVNEIV